MGLLSGKDIPTVRIRRPKKWLPQVFGLNLNHGMQSSDVHRSGGGDGMRRQTGKLKALVS